jgi:putative flippase GtrA
VSISFEAMMPKQFRRFYATEHGRKLTRYAMVSVVAVPVGELSIVVGVHVLALTAGWAGVFGNCMGAIPSYYLNRTWVWGKGGRSHVVKEVLPFWGVTLVGIAFAGWFVHLGGNFSTDHKITGASRTLILLGSNLFAFGILWVGKYILFNKVLFAVVHHDGKPHTAEEHIEAGLAGAAGDPFE